MEATLICMWKGEMGNENQFAYSSKISKKILFFMNEVVLVKNNWLY